MWSNTQIMNLISGRITKHFNKTWLHITSCTVHTSGTQNEASSADMIIQRHTYYKQEKAIRRMNLLFVFKVPITCSSSFIAMNISLKTFSPVLNSVLMQHKFAAQKIWKAQSVSKLQPTFSPTIYFKWKNTACDKWFKQFLHHQQRQVHYQPTLLNFYYDIARILQ